MFGDDDDSQRIKNFILFKFYGTNKELDEAAPAMGCVAILIIVGVVVWYFFFR